MYKKYQTSGGFRNLVRPALASGFIPSGFGEEMPNERAQSFGLSSKPKKESDKDKKKCC
jgi:hypothetical protein